MIKNMFDLSNTINQIIRQYRVSPTVQTATTTPSIFIEELCRQGMKVSVETLSLRFTKMNWRQNQRSIMLYPLYDDLSQDDAFLAGLNNLTQSNLTSLLTREQPKIGVMNENYTDHWSQKNEQLVHINKGELFSFNGAEINTDSDGRDTRLYIFTTTDTNYIRKQFKMDRAQVTQYTTLSPADLDQAMQPTGFLDGEENLQPLSTSFSEVFKQDFVLPSTTTTDIPQCNNWEEPTLTRVSSKKLHELEIKLDRVGDQIDKDNFKLFNPLSRHHLSWGEYKDWFAERLKSVEVYEANTQPIAGIPAVYEPAQNRILVAKGHMNLFLMMHELSHSQQNFEHEDSDPLRKELEVYRTQQNFIFAFAGVALPKSRKSGRTLALGKDFIDNPIDTLRTLTRDIQSPIIGGADIAHLCSKLSEKRDFITLMDTISKLPVSEPEKLSLRQLIMARLGFMRADDGSIIFADGDRTRELITPLYKDHYHLD